MPNGRSGASWSVVDPQRVVIELRQIIDDSLPTNVPVVRSESRQLTLKGQRLVTGELEGGDVVAATAP
jgi:hypothetical protein